jgi:hypothetical protein
VAGFPRLAESDDADTKFHVEDAGLRMRGTGKGIMF